MYYRGFKIIVSPKQYDADNLFIYLEGKRRYYIKLGNSPMGYLIRINNFINKLEDYLKGLKTRFNSNMDYYKQGSFELAKKDSYSEEITKLKQELKKIDDMLIKEEEKK